MQSHHAARPQRGFATAVVFLLFAIHPLLHGADGSRGGEAQPPLVAADFSALPAGQPLELFLLVGQSNMKGRGAIDMAPTTDSRILFLHPTKHQWFIARDPLHAVGTPDAIDGSDNSGTGPAMSFARTLMQDEAQPAIGLIPAAKGGVPIHTYDRDGKMYELSLRMLKQAREQAATPTSLKAILWLQGESDSMSPQRRDAYEGKLLELVDRYRRDLQQPDLPFIACTIGSFIAESDKARRFAHTREINEILLRLPTQRRHTACIDARDLAGHIGDNLHYNAAAQREIGRRFAQAYQRLVAQPANP